MTKIKLHGTNGWFETENGKTSCVGVYTDDCVILLDIGTGFRDVNPNETQGKHVYLFISHLHLDHIYGLHLLSLHSPSHLRIFLPEDLIEHFIAISKVPFIKPIDSLGFPVDIVGIKPRQYMETTFSFEALPLLHNTTSFGYRLKFPEKSISYCVDTKLCENVYRISDNADVFICDAALKIHDSPIDKFHMKIEDAFKVASKSNVKLLILTHFGAVKYKSLRERELEAELLESEFCNYIVGIDGKELTL
jgi:ribonuclease BN (tRNA processing enzyme)